MSNTKASPRTLEDMFQEPGFLLRRAHQLSSAAFVMEAGAVDITPVQFITLLAISNTADTDAATVSELIAFDRTTVGQVLFRLESKGLIVKRGSDVDRRKKILQITDAGQQVLDEVLAMTPKIADNIIGVLSDDERRTFISILQKIIKAPANERLVHVAQ
ncbi:MAG: MarR family winged helix-turn-helix transcriptional regulator [Rhizobiaceae bacterium]|nr:MarR family winged helix-turn-helix transcriptional regulator [Rhizobiaceae bacterium]